MKPQIIKFHVELISKGCWTLLTWHSINLQMFMHCTHKLTNMTGDERPILNMVHKLTESQLNWHCKTPVNKSIRLNAFIAFILSKHCNMQHPIWCVELNLIFGMFVYTKSRLQFIGCLCERGQIISQITHANPISFQFSKKFLIKNSIVR